MKTKFIPYCISGVLAAGLSWPVFAMNHGGMVGGGGNVIVRKPLTNPARTDIVEDLIEASQNLLVIYLKQKEIALNEGRLDQDENNDFHALFSPEMNIFDHIRFTQIDVNEDGPCLDFQGLPVDASIPQAPNGRICVSAKTISEKINFEEVQWQTVALLLHEYAEVMGLSEEMAVDLQTHALDNLY